jgi:hypothetical protein
MARTRRIGEEGEESGTYTGDGGEHDEEYHPTLTLHTDGGEHDEEYHPTLTLHTAADAQQDADQNGDEESVTEQTGANVTRLPTRIYWPPVVANHVQETYRIITEKHAHSSEGLVTLNLALAMAFANLPHEEAEEDEVRMLRHASAACDMMNEMKRKRRRTE